MHVFVDRIRKFRGKPVYEILGKTKQHQEFFVMYREWLDGKKHWRNIVYRPIAGYQAYGEPGKFEDATRWIKKTPTIVYSYPKAEELETITEIYPDFKYIIAKKKELIKKDVFKTLKMWLDFPKMEILLNMDFQTIAMDRNFFKMSEKSQKETINYFLKNPDGFSNSSVATKWIRGAMKYKTTAHNYYDFTMQNSWYKVDYNTFNYLNKKKIAVKEYLDYKGHLERDFPERLKDPYWTEFNDVHDFHKKENKVNEEIRNRRELEDKIAREKKERDFAKISKKFRKWNGRFNGLDVYIPSKIEDIELQAEKLNQCLIDCDYIQDMIDKQCVLVFIRKNGIPMATAELTGKKWNTVNQFYGDELDRDNCDPPPECEKALNIFMDKFIRKSA